MEQMSGKPTHFDLLARINVSNLDRYYRLVETQTSRSFTVAIGTGLVGFALILGGLAIGFTDNSNAETLSYVSSAAGVVTEFLAAVFFVLYRKTVRQLKDYHDSLLLVQSALLAFKAVDDLEDESRKVSVLKGVIDRVMAQQGSSAAQRSYNAAADDAAGA